MNNYSQSEMQKQIKLIFSRNANTGEKLYAYIQVNNETLEKLQDSMNRGTIANLGSFGKIIYSGTEKPNDLVKNYMREEYNFVE